MSQPQLVANDLRRSFRIGSRRIEVLRGISLAVEQGEAVFLCGASGAGKSSLLHAGLVPRLRVRGARVVTMVPSSRPCDQLRTALAAVAASADRGDGHRRGTAGQLSSTVIACG